MSKHVEYRAIIRRPASILDSPEEREQGFKEYETREGLSKKSVQESDWALKHSEESHAYVYRWEKRVVEAGEWETEKEDHE